MQAPFHSHTASEAMREWEEAGTLLINAFTRYLDLSRSMCSTLEIKRNSGGLLAKIDSLLLGFCVTLDQHLNELRMTLTKSRNRVGSPIYSLPEEILCRIFSHNVYGLDASLSKIPMPGRVWTIYHRIYTLISVCTVWRKIGLSYGAFWSILPVFDLGQSHEVLPPTEHILQRASSGDLHLAVSIQHPQLVQLQNLLDPLKAYIFRFRTVTISSGSSYIAKVLVDVLLSHNAIESISKLSLQRKVVGRATKALTLPRADDYLNPGGYPLQTQLGQLIQSLSVLRISHIFLNWSNITFSPRLVELRLEHVLFVNHADARLFLQALSSAHQLRDPKITSVTTRIGDRDEEAPFRLSLPISLPNLRHLQLGDIAFGDLCLFLSAIAPGLHSITLFITSLITYKLLQNNKWSRTEIGPLCEFLVQFPVEKIILGGHKWSDADSWAKMNLNGVLRSTPALKALILDSYTLDHNILQTLSPVQGADSDNRDDKFPRLDSVEFRRAKIEDGGAELKGFIEAQVHPIGTLVLGATLQHGSGSARTLQENDEIVGWLKENVPDFRLVDNRHGAPDTTGKLSVLQLWDE
ncbi:unnamed protein product [Rhizoctonia solani]|uniref:F-box domain-containing protein n=1 Tax=Rhizoctonia solani TaxID=456999 RepID=A0A8H3CW00_9AGAM|nr:unnamed protein product [Rhizoctonia solani]